MNNNFLKVLSYFRQYGFRVTLFKIIGKITKRDLVYEFWYKKMRPSEQELDEQKNHRFVYQPQISIAVPLYKTPEKYLKELVDSVKAQTYANWELCLSDGSGENSPIKEILKEYEEGDCRIKVVYNEQPLHISHNTNAALDIASGDYIAFADHDDLLAPNLLYECVKELNKDPSVEIIYTDEDKIDMKGKERFAPHFKPDFNIDMLRSGNYVCHFFVVKRSIFEEVGPLRHEYDGAQDFDFTLRCIEKTSHIRHIPKILYHWRAHKDSTAENPESKNYAYEAGVKAVQAHYKRLGIEASVEQSNHKGVYRTKYILKDKPLVSIIVINQDNSCNLERTIKTIRNKNQYKNYEIIIVDNKNKEQRMLEYYETIKNSQDINVVYGSEQNLNDAMLYDLGVEHAKGSHLLFLQNGSEILNEKFIEEMLGYSMRKDVGVVGSKICQEDGTIYHAGVIVGLGSTAGNAFEGCAYGLPGYFGRIDMVQNYSAVSGKCMMIKKELFVKMGGFDKQYIEELGDVDLCLRVQKAGYVNVYTPYAEVKQPCIKIIENNTGDKALFREKWKELLNKGDSCYNPNLSLDRYGFGLKSNME